MVNQRLALLFPPAWDPCEPYLAVPALAAYVRERGVPTLASDVNGAFFRRVLSREYLEGSAAELLGRRAVRGDAAAAAHLEMLPATVGNAEKACAVLSDPETFFDLNRFTEARKALALALETASAAWAPTRFDFSRFEMRYPLSASRALGDAVLDQAENPFIEFFECETIPSLRSFQPTVVGISISSFKQLVGGWTLARLIRQSLPGVFVLVGGNIFSRFEENLRTDPELYRWVDGYVVGEGETPLTALLDTLDTGKGLGTVPALFWRADWRDAGREAPNTDDLRRNPPPEPLDLDTLPTPDFEGYSSGDYFSPLPVLPLETSRGCSWGRCAFCSHHLVGGTFRMRSPDLVLEDIRTLEQRYGARHFTFVDNNLPVRTMRRLSEGLLEGGPHIFWSGYARYSKHFDRTFCRLLHDAGCRSLWFGLESANQRVLDSMEKGTSVDLARQVSLNCFETGITVDFFCMIGFPTEQAGEALETFAFIAELQQEIFGANALYSLESFALDTCSKMMVDPGAYSVRLLERKKQEEGGNVFDFDLSPIVAYAPEKGLTMTQVSRMVEGFHLRLERMFGRLPLTVEDREAFALLHRAHPEFQRRLTRWLNGGRTDQQQGAAPAQNI